MPLTGRNPSGPWAGDGAPEVIACETVLHGYLCGVRTAVEGMTVRDGDFQASYKLP